MCVSWERARVSARAKGQRSSGHVSCCCAKEAMYGTSIWDDGTSRSQFLTHICKEKCARAQTSGAAAWEEGVWCKQHVSSIKIAPNNSHLVVYDNHWLAAKPNLSNFANPSRQQLYGNSVSMCVCVCVRMHVCVCLQGVCCHFWCLFFYSVPHMDLLLVWRECRRLGLFATNSPQLWIFMDWQTETLQSWWLLRPRDKNVCFAYLKISNLNGSATVGVWKGQDLYVCSLYKCL